MIVWLVIAHPGDRADLRTCLHGNGFDVTVERGCLEEMIGCGDKSLRSPDLIILDGAQGVAGFAMLKVAQPRARIVVLAESVDLAQLADSFAAGADGYLPKKTPPNVLVTSLRLAAVGEKVLPSTLTNFLFKMQSTQSSLNEYVQIDDVLLSRRELEFMRRVTDGQSNGTIAAELEIPEAAVKVHEKHVLRKLGATTRTQVAAWAAEHGVLSR